MKAFNKTKGVGVKILITTQIVDRDDPILGFMHGWITEFAKYFDHIDVICLKEGKHNLPSHVHVHSLGKEEGENRLKYTLRFYKYFWNLYLFSPVDYVFYHMGAIYNVLAIPFFFIRHFKKTKFVWWKAHGHINTFGRLAALFCDEIVTSTASGFPIEMRKRRIVGQAIDTSLFTMGEGAREKSMIFVGRIMPVKKIEVFLETFARLREEGVVTTASIVGPVGDDTYYDGLLKKCDAHTIDRSVFVGSRTQTELVALYQGASIFLNTSVTHSMDKTVLEAMLCGCIPVTSNKAFIEMLRQHDLFVDDGTVDAYEERIRKLAATNTTEMRAELRDVVTQDHSLETLTKRIFNFEKES